MYKKHYITMYCISKNNSHQWIFNFKSCGITCTCTVYVYLLLCQKWKRWWFLWTQEQEPASIRPCRRRLQWQCWRSSSSERSDSACGNCSSSCNHCNQSIEKQYYNLKQKFTTLLHFHLSSCNRKIKCITKINVYHTIRLLSFLL